MGVEAIQDSVPDAEEAIEVLAEQLGECWSSEDENHCATAWESTFGRPLKRSYETWPEYTARAQKFAPVISGRNFSMDPASARDRLNHLHTAESLSDSQKREYHELQDILGEAPRDFSKAVAGEADTNKLARDRYMAIVGEDKKGKLVRRAWTDQVSLIAKESNIGALDLLITQSEHEQVREAASKRRGQVELGL